jgi:hypothetical protein
VPYSKLRIDEFRIAPGQAVVLAERPSRTKPLHSSNYESTLRTTMSRLQSVEFHARSSNPQQRRRSSCAARWLSVELSRQVAEREGFEIRRWLNAFSKLLTRIGALVPSDPPDSTYLPPDLPPSSLHHSQGAASYKSSFFGTVEALRMRTLVDVQSVSPDRPRIVMEFEPRAACYRTPTLEANGNSLIRVDRSRKARCSAMRRRS